MEKRIGRITGILLALLLAIGMTCAVCFAADVIPEGISIEGGDYYVNLPTDGTTTININEGFTANFKVYDDGGRDGNHSAPCYSHLVINAPENTWLQVSGTMTCANKAGNKGALYIYDGSSTDDAVLLDGFVSDKPYNPVNIGKYLSTGHSLHIYFWYQSSSYTYEGLELTVEQIRIGSDFEGEGTETSPFIIKNAANWEKACEYISMGAGTTSCFKLSDQFNNSTPVTSMIGTSEYPFRGVFDGNGKTLRVDINKQEQSEGAAPFQYIKGATIKNLNVTGSVQGSSFAAGLVAFSDSDRNSTPNKIENCVIDTDVSVSGSDQRVGGVLAHAKSSVITIRDTIFSGTMTSSGGSAGGIIGWADGPALTMHDCLFKGMYEGGGVFHPIAVQNAAANTRALVTGCMYTQEPTLTDPDQIIVAGNLICAEPLSNKVCSTGTLVAIDGNAYYAAVSPKGLQAKYEYQDGKVIHLGCIFSIAGDTALTKDVDYTQVIKDSKGKTKGAATDKGEYTITITGKGNYTGSQTFRFKVVDAAKHNATGLMDGIQPARGGEVYMGGISWKIIGKNSDKWLLISSARMDEDPIKWDEQDSRCAAIYDGFSQIEKDAVVPATKNDRGFTYKTSPANCNYGESSLTNASLFLLSGEEAVTYFDSDAARLPGEWWLRSPICGSTDEMVGSVGDYGGMLITSLRAEGQYVRHHIRPAFQLNADRVVCLSGLLDIKSDAAGSGRFGNFVAASDSGQKLTLVDDSRNGFAADPAGDAVLTVPVGYSGWTIPLEYSGAVRGTDEYVSAILCDAGGEVLCYASLTPAANGSGTWDLSIPDGMEQGRYTLKVFSEHQNDGTIPDYASAPVSIPLVVTDSLDKVTIAAITDRVCTGKVITPALTITDRGVKLVKNVDYTVACKSKNVGKATITITGTGVYTGTRTKTFKIIPKGTTIKTPVKAKRAITVKWTRQSAKMSTSRITGYEIQIATNSKFTKNKKTVKVKGYKNTAKKITKLKAKKKYYVRVRTYKSVSGVNYYSKWSSIKSVTTK